MQPEQTHAAATEKRASRWAVARSQTGSCEAKTGRGATRRRTGSNECACYSMAAEAAARFAFERWGKKQPRRQQRALRFHRAAAAAGALVCGPKHGSAVARVGEVSCILQLLHGGGQARGRAGAPKDMLSATEARAGAGARRRRTAGRGRTWRAPNKLQPPARPRRRAGAGACRCCQVAAPGGIVPRGLRLRVPGPCARAKRAAGPQAAAHWLLSWLACGRRPVSGPFEWAGR